MPSATHKGILLFSIHSVEVEKIIIDKHDGTLHSTKEDVKLFDLI